MCIVVNTECGQQTAENCTYLSSDTAGQDLRDNSDCTYTICKMNSNICRIKLDFEVKLL